MPMCADPEVADVRQTVILPGLKISATCRIIQDCQQKADARKNDTNHSRHLDNISCTSIAAHRMIL